MYDAEIRGFHIISTNPQRKNGIRQKGIWEYMLCEDCEHCIGEYENYAARLYNIGPGLDCERQHDILVFTGIEYRSFKLFLLSLLWRLAVTTKELQGLKLSVADCERLRQMVLAGEPGTSFEFPAVVIGLTFDRQHQTDLILPPWESTDGERTFWNFTANGLLFMFQIGHQPPKRGIQGLILNENGAMGIPMREMREIPYIWDYFRRTAEAEALRSQHAR